jgi:hypothetical protein
MRRKRFRCDEDSLFARFIGELLTEYRRYPSKPETSR